VLPSVRQLKPPEECFQVYRMRYSWRGSERRRYPARTLRILRRHPSVKVRQLGHSAAPRLKREELTTTKLTKLVPKSSHFPCHLGNTGKSTARIQCMVMTIMWDLYTERNESCGAGIRSKPRTTGEGYSLEELSSDDDPRSSGVGRTSMAVWL